MEGILKKYRTSTVFAFPKAIFAYFSIAIAIASSYPLFESLRAKMTLATSQEQEMVVSNRSKVFDTKYIIESEGNDKLQYIRSTDPFATNLTKQFGQPQLAENEIRFYKFVNHQAVSSQATGDGEQEFNKIAYLQNMGKEFPYIPASILLGLGLGLIFSLKLGSMVPSILGLSGISMVKYLTACPTCPRATILGIDAALVGFCIYALLSCGLMIEKESSLKMRRLTGLVLASNCCWQLISWWSLRQQCLPCSVIGCGAGWLLSSWPSLMAKEQKESINYKVLIGWASLALAVFQVQGGFNERIQKDGLPSHHLVALGKAKAISLKNISELGVKPSGKKEVFLIAAVGCHACELACETVDSIQTSGVQFFSTTDGKPDSRHNWHQLPNGSIITSTPTTVFVEKDGSVSRIMSGASADVGSRQLFASEILKFLDHS